MQQSTDDSRHLLQQRRTYVKVDAADQASRKG